MDDPYPGYGKIHRQLEEAREEYIEVKNLVEDELDSMKNKQIKEFFYQAIHILDC